MPVKMPYPYKPEDDPEMFRRLNKRDAIRRAKKNSTSTWFEAVERHEEVRMMQLYEAGQDLDELDTKTGSTALYIATRNDEPGIVQWLLENGANPAIPTEPDKVSCAWIAISKGCKECVKLLCDPKYKFVEQVRDLEGDDGAQSMYKLAVMRRRYEIVHIVEEALGIDPKDSKIPQFIDEPPKGWAMEYVPTEIGPDAPMKPFFWETFKSKAPCQYHPPPGSKHLVHKGKGIFEVEYIVGE
eukprot:CAMPEP_0119316826 /NCGR_PEP_ID=MMETSP1333-20130426/41033_1 /TAXON_ID=418940 /ORGANISM="Scyphosphaera apsteinii, Strain RCC1455" /LENGTH=240 /DNA_ID=CAMNT_0007322583 /DNA_START=60 /DNA_END=782 /DNA_ORIENTATION=+